MAEQNKRKQGKVEQISYGRTKQDKQNKARQNK